MLLQQRIKNEDMAAKWRGEEYTSLQKTAAREADPNRSSSEVARLSDATADTAGASAGAAGRRPARRHRRRAARRPRRPSRRHPSRATDRPVGPRHAPRPGRLAGQALKAQGFDYFCFLSAIDWMPSPYGKGEDDPPAPTGRARPEPARSSRAYTGGETRFQMFARLTDLKRHVGVTIKADVPDSMTMPTWITVFAGANWHERETHEMFGIGFDGHPDLRNLYLPGRVRGLPAPQGLPVAVAHGEAVAGHRRRRADAAATRRGAEGTHARRSDRVREAAEPPMTTERS